MPGSGWRTPDDTPTGSVVIALTIPAGEEWERIVRGALSALLRDESFEPDSGALSPETTASIFEQFMFDTWEWEPC